MSRGELSDGARLWTGFLVRWCNGSTEVFGAFSRGSNPRRTATCGATGSHTESKPSGHRATISQVKLDASRGNDLHRNELFCANPVQIRDRPGGPTHGV